MSAAEPKLGWIAAARELLGSPRFSATLTQASLGTLVGAALLQKLIGWPGFIAVISGLALFAMLSLAAQFRLIEWQGLLPVSLLVFIGWAGLSLFWSEYQWSTLAGLLYLAVVSTLGIYIALVRDTIQIVRAFGDVLRVALGVSLLLEVVVGLLLDTAAPFIGLHGNLAELGPLQGIFGARNQLGIVALVGLVTFLIEWRTRSVPRLVAVGSLIASVICILLTRSPIVIATLVIAGVAGVALYSLRRSAPAHRRFWQLGIVVIAILVTTTGWIARGPLVSALRASGEVNLRLTLWNRVADLIPLNELQGWGWVGRWRAEVLPFPGLVVDGPRDSASGAFIDVWFQLGLVGLFLLTLLLGLTFVRSWLLASEQRSVTYAWPALVLVVLLSTAFVESSLLVEFGWLTFVVCCVKAAKDLSWRRAFSTE